MIRKMQPVGTVSWAGGVWGVVDCETLGTRRATLRPRVREVEGVINNEEKNIQTSSKKKRNGLLASGNPPARKSYKF